MALLAFSGIATYIDVQFQKLLCVFTLLRATTIGGTYIDAGPVLRTDSNIHSGGGLYVVFPEP